MFHPFFKLVKKTYIALIMLSIFHYIPAQVPETAPLPGDNQVECSLGMWIEKVVGNQKAWKVVISGKKIIWIDVKGFDFTPSEPYEWGLGSGSGPGYHNRWILQSATSLVDKGFIPQYALPELNDEFGSTNGTIRLKDKYNNPVYSTDLRPNRKAQVFFLKDEPNFWKMHEPNWFYYWKQFVSLGKGIELIYEGDLGNVGGYVYPGGKTIYIGKNASTINARWGRTGIHLLVEVIAHENEHITIFEELWPFGYNPDKDCNSPNSDCDNDRYPTWFELSEKGVMFGFSPLEPTDNYDEKTLVVEDELWFSNPAGYKYEEYRCRRIAEPNANVKIYDQFDWSFDPEGLYQGKQFK